MEQPGEPLALSPPASSDRLEVVRKQEPENDAGVESDPNLENEAIIASKILEEMPLTKGRTAHFELRDIANQLSEDELIEKSSYWKFLNGIFRSSITLGVSVIAMLMANYGMSIEKIAAFTSACCFSFYLIHIWYSFCKAERIFRIYTVSAIPENWINMSVALHNNEYPTVPLQSISEFSAISGGYGKGSLLRVGTVTWLSAVFVAVVRIQDSAVGLEQILKDGLVFEMIGAFGLDVIGTFYLDPFSRKMQLGHYSGVFCCMGTLVGLWMQTVSLDQYYVITSIVTAVGVVFFGLFFVYYPYLYNPSAEEMKKPEVVTSISRKILLFETLGLGMCALAFVLFMCFQRVKCEPNCGGLDG